MTNVENELFIKGTDKKNTTLIVSFAGNALEFGRIPQYEFVKSLNIIYPECDKLFYVDKTQKHYLNGILNISKNVEETKVYLENKIKNYKKVCFIGTSAGGYASILYGSLLNIDYVLAFIPQTKLENKKNIFSKNNIQYIDLKKFINSTTKYKLIGDLSKKNKNDLHHISQCDNIKNFKNVNIVYKNKVNLKQIRDSGELKKIIIEFFNFSIKT